MGLFKRIRKKIVEKVQAIELEGSYENVNRALSKDDAFVILNEEVKELFPKTGVWTFDCLKKSNEINKIYLPCYLRDNVWLTKYFQGKLTDEKIYVPSRYVKEFVETSEVFAEERHNYELEIVKWQIEHMKNGGESWLLPESYDRSSVFYSPDVDIIFRSGVVNTLLMVGLDLESIEEGVEKYAHLWRRECMDLAFINEYNPINLDKVAPEPPTRDFEEMWRSLREYSYYHKHRESVEKYGRATRSMLMGSSAAQEISRKFEPQARERSRYLLSWAEYAPYKVKLAQVYDSSSQKGE